MGDMLNDHATALPAAIEHALEQIERQCDCLRDALKRGEPEALQQAGAGLRQLALDCSDLLARHEQTGAAAPALRARIRALAATLAALRENLLRRAAVVERAVEVVLPGQEKATYAPAVAASRPVFRAYGA